MKKQLLALSALSLLASASIPSVHAEEDYRYAIAYDQGYMFFSSTNEKYRIPSIGKISYGRSEGNITIYDYVKRQCVEEFPLSSTNSVSNAQLAEFYAYAREHNIQFDDRHLRSEHPVFNIQDTSCPRLARVSNMDAKIV